MVEIEYARVEVGSKIWNPHRRFDDAAYARALACAELGADLEALPLGDATVVGERGVNLSGGQQARVQVGRAAYSAYFAHAHRRTAFDQPPPLVVLLDDVLAAVDGAVQRALFANLRALATDCGCGVVLATHQRHFLEEADAVVYLQANGRSPDAHELYLGGPGGILGGERWPEAVRRRSEARAREDALLLSDKAALRAGKG